MYKSSDSSSWNELMIVNQFGFQVAWSIKPSFTFEKYNYGYEKDMADDDHFGFKHTRVLTLFHHLNNPTICIFLI